MRGRWLQTLCVLASLCVGSLVDPASIPRPIPRSRSVRTVPVHPSTVEGIAPIDSPLSTPDPLKVKLHLNGEFVAQAPWAITYEVLRLRANGGCLERYSTVSFGQVEFIPEAYPLDLYLTASERALLRETGKRVPLAYFALEDPRLLDRTPAPGHRELMRRWTVHTTLSGRTIPFTEEMNEEFMVARRRIEGIQTRHLVRTIRAGVRPCGVEQPF